MRKIGGLGDVSLWSCITKAFGLLLSAEQDLQTLCWDPHIVIFEFLHLFRSLRELVDFLVIESSIHPSTRKINFASGGPFLDPKHKFSFFPENQKSADAYEYAR